MAVVLCKRCEGTGWVCARCGLPWGNSGNRKELWTGRLKNKHRGRGPGRCNAKQARCGDHVESYVECDIGGERSPLSGGALAAGWTYQQVPGTDARAQVCPGCVGKLRVGFDIAMQRDSTYIESVACAFAFQLGQQLGGPRSNWRHRESLRMDADWVATVSAGGWIAHNIDRPRAVTGAGVSTLGGHRITQIIVDDPIGQPRERPGDDRIDALAYSMANRQPVLGHSPGDPPLVHVLFGGRSLCGTFDGRNPSAHLWVSLEAVRALPARAREITCAECLTAARLRNGTHLVAEPNYGTRREDTREVVTLTGTSLCGLELEYGGNWEAISLSQHRAPGLIRPIVRELLCRDCLTAADIAARVVEGAIA